MINIYSDGACIGNPGPGGWAAVIIGEGNRREITGQDDRTTSNRMEIMAAIKGLEGTPPGSRVRIHSDSQYLVQTMTKNWKRKANLDLWHALDMLVGERDVSWSWVRGHTGHPENERANRLANELAGVAEYKEAGGDSAPTHFDAEGKARMVDITPKKATGRVAVAGASVAMKPATLKLIKQGEAKKGDVLTVAQIAGIMAAKQTPQLIPLCHPLPLTSIDMSFELDEAGSRVEITATVRTLAQTGVEMEALTAAAAAALTIYDMCKAADRAMRIENMRLIRKSGGRSGDIELE